MIKASALTHPHRSRLLISRLEWETNPALYTLLTPRDAVLEPYAEQMSIPESHPAIAFILCCLDNPRWVASYTDSDDIQYYI